MASILSIGEIRGLNENGNVVTVPNGHKLTAEAGGIAVPGQVLQVITTQFSDTTTSSTLKYYVPVNGSDTTIIARGNNSKFLLLTDTNGYSASINGFNLGFYRGTTLIRGYAPDGSTGDMWQAGFNGWTNGNGSLGASKSHMDSPGVVAGTSLTYKVALGVWGGSWSINHAGYGATSTLTVMEIAQ